MNLKRFFDAAQAANAKVTALAEQINDLFEKNQVEDAQKLRPDLEKAKAEAKEANEMYLSMLDATKSNGTDPASRFTPMGGDPEPRVVKDMRGSAEYVRAFFSALKNGVTPKTINGGIHSGENFGILLNAITEAGGSPAGSEGGFLLPIDFDNMIVELKRALVDLALSVNVESVTAYSGWRAIETAKAALPFAAIVVANGLGTSESPTFTKVDYTLIDYGGYLPVSNGFLQDTPVNIMAYLARWFSRKEVLTNNSLILALINAISPTAVTDYKTVVSRIKTALNKTLDPAISAGASLFVNQSGLDLLDQLQDGVGRPLLQPDPQSDINFRVKGRPVVVLSDTEWANTDTNTKTRIAIGGGREFITYFRRSTMELATTAIGGDAWRKNNTEVRGIMRADAKVADSGAMTVLSVTLPA
jgi:HK97 family phage major capsid protein